MLMLSTEDYIEMALRRLSAWVCENRTGDRSGAKAMLAFAAPGGNTDIAPTWLVKEAAEHSKMEHQRSERVTAANRRGGGGGRGRGRGGTGGAAGGDQDAAQAQAPDRGRGGRRGRGRRGPGPN